MRFPIPSKRVQVVIPLDEKDATLLKLESKLPIPRTLMRSPGLFKVPWKGPSFPIAETIITPFAVNSFIFSIKGISKKSLLPFERLTISISF